MARSLPTIAETYLNTLWGATLQAEAATQGEDLAHIAGPMQKLA